MFNKPLLYSVAAFVLAALLALGAAMAMTTLVEHRNTSALRAAMTEAGLTWVSVQPDGLNVTLGGSAPDESARIRALQVAGAVMDASRISETIAVARHAAVVAPVFRIEVMRNRDEISVIGLVPADEGDNPITDRLSAALPGARVEDMLQTSDYAVPGGWVAAEAFAVEALQRFRVGRISVSAGRIEVEALVDSAEARRTLEAALREIAPRGQVLALDLIAPRPVAAPFLLRVDAEAGALRVTACSADTDAAQTAIADALVAAGGTQRLNCPLALGAPSPRWGEAAAVSIAALAALGDGSLTISDGTVVLVAAHTVDAAAYDRAVGRLETSLPDAFSLDASHQEAPATDAADTAAPEVVLTLDAEGRVTIAGRLPDERIRDAVQAMAGARFGRGAVDMAARLSDDLPQGWALRVLTGVEALSELHDGIVRVRPDTISVSGNSGNPDVRNQVAQAVVQGLGADAVFQSTVQYVEALDPVANAPTPDNCEARIQAIQAETKINFDPGSARIDTASGRVIDQIADVLHECGELPFEVAGYTDSQGREETNLNLSQARAEAVINALLARRVLVASLVARGYGAADPIADNGTEAGREANRRIEFHLIRPEAPPEPLDPALEAQLTFEIQTPGADTVRPRPRPGAPDAADVAPTVGSGDEDQADAAPAAADE
ncbi:MAG: OmpA family protein [Rhodobacter sp.]|uniref:OmpA family protein n=1 Tax=Pararhodobacter sp. TaxID=2127056 RepID=UPI001DCE2936|nr:OmpA family protein [Pararhodobacter sp.]MCB1343990.1 OmpA family protein [Paracoccaceae bacterium]MCC0071753.1 OmpA family protein [Rhodobacter sp.]HPD93253.1 OmpA family protein [Pararhodobacter sp.]